MPKLPDVVPTRAIRHRFIVYKGKSRYLRQLFCCEDKYTWEQDYYCVVICTGVVVAETNNINKGFKPTQTRSVPVSALPIIQRVRLG